MYTLLYSHPTCYSHHHSSSAAKLHIFLIYRKKNTPNFWFLTLEIMAVPKNIPIFADEKLFSYGRKQIKQS
jgi:hypothetical protein